MGVFKYLMHFLEIKFLHKLPKLKISYFKAAILMSLIVYWSVILVGTFVTFN